MSRSAFAAVIIAFLGMIGAFWIEDTVFERVPQLEDEVAYIYQAKIFAAGDVYIGEQAISRAFWQPFIIDCDSSNSRYKHLDCGEVRRFGKYPPGWPLLLALGYKFGLEWAVNPLIFFLTIVLTYRLAREIFGAPVGVIAAVLLASSPIALIQSASLMAHTAALFFTMLTLYGVWRLEISRYTWVWGAVAGIALGMLVAIRPMTGASVAIPLVVYSGLRLIVTVMRNYWEPSPWAKFGMLYGLLLFGVGVALWVTGQIPFWHSIPVVLIGGAIAINVVLFVQSSLPRVNPPWPRQFSAALTPLLIMGSFTIIFGSLWPAYNWITTGNPTENLYELIWDYDKIGFGPGHGRYEGERGIVDNLPAGFGAGYDISPGHSWRRARGILREDTECYSRDLFGWVAQPDDRPDRPIRGNACMTGSKGYSWLLLPFGLILGWRRRWTHLLFLVAVIVIGTNVTYWIGSGVFSARYYYEATGVLAILSAVGLIGLADAVKPLHIQNGVYALFVLVVGFALISFTPGRIKGLHRYENIGKHQIEAVDRWRTDEDRGVLVIAYGEVSWREVGALMALTSPYLDSEYILARDPDRVNVDALKAMFPDRDVVYYANGQFSPGLVGLILHGASFVSSITGLP